MLTVKNYIKNYAVTYVALHFEIKWISILSDKKSFALIFTLAIFNVLFIILFATT
jgi:hypothetical protein